MKKTPWYFIQRMNTALRTIKSSWDWLNFSGTVEYALITYRYRSYLETSLKLLNCCFFFKFSSRKHWYKISWIVACVGSATITIEMLTIIFRRIPATINEDVFTNHSSLSILKKIIAWWVSALRSTINKFGWIEFLGWFIEVNKSWQYSWNKPWTNLLSKELLDKYLGKLLEEIQGKINDTHLWNP